jgi:hypothetical protein
MKRSIIFGFLLLIGGIAFGQTKKDIDPSYSTRNYKHSNKANKARKDKLDQTVQLTQVLDWSPAEYKHRYNQSGLVVKGSFKTKKVSSSKAGYKHPVGL